MSSKLNIYEKEQTNLFFKMEQFLPSSKNQNPTNSHKDWMLLKKNVLSLANLPVGPHFEEG